MSGPAPNHGRASLTSMFLGQDAASGGPFALLGLRPGSLSDAQILAARDQRMREIDAHRLAETPEADEVRLSLYAATAQLLNPAIRAQLIRSWGPPGAEALRPPDRPGLTPGSPERLLEHDAILALAMFGGWNQRSLRHIASIAHARGLTSQDVAKTLRRIGRQRRPRQVVHQDKRARRSGTAPVAKREAPTPARRPVSPLEPLPEQIDPAQRMIKMALIVTGVGALTLLVLFGGVYAVLSADAGREPAPRTPRVETSVADVVAPRIPRTRPTGSPASVQRQLPAPELLGDPALVVHELEAARRGLELAPYESTRRFAEAVRLLSESWIGFQPDQLDRANAAVEAYLVAVVSPDVARLALDAVGAGAAGLDASGGAIDADQVLVATWSAGMLAELRRNPVLGATRAQQIDRLRRAVSGEGRGGTGFRSGATLGARVIGERMGASGADLDAWRRWIEAVDAIASGDESVRTDMISGVLESMLTAGAPDTSVVRELALTMSWRRHEGARRWLVLMLARPSVDQRALAGLIETLVQESAASGLDATMVLAPNATSRERGVLAQRLTEAWRLGRDDRADSFVQDFAAIVRSAERERDRPGDAIVRFGAAVRLAYANAGAALARDERFEEAARALDAASTFRPQRSSARRADPLGGDDDGRWALAFAEANDSADDRFAALDRLGKRMNARIGQADAETLLDVALRGHPRGLRERAQTVVTKFVASPAMVNALLERADDLPASPEVVRLVELATGRPIDRDSGDGSWRIEARRALLETLIEMIASEGEGGGLDAMARELEAAYAMTLGGGLSEGGAQAAGELPESARAIALRYQREANVLGGGAGLGWGALEIERRRRSRLALAETSMQRFLAEQIAMCESLGALASGERGGVSGEVSEVLDTLAQELRDSSHVLDQITATELGIARLWLLREGVSP